MIEPVLPYLGPVGLILLALLAGVVSPGPSFVQVARIAVSRSRADRLAAAAGMGLGALVFAALALAGLHALLTAVPGLYVALKVLGGCTCYGSPSTSGAGRTNRWRWVLRMASLQNTPCGNRFALGW